MEEKLIIEDEYISNTSWIFKTSYLITNSKDEFVHQILVIVRPFTSTWNTLYTSTFMFRFCFQPSHLPLHHHLLLAWFGNEFFFPYSMSWSQLIDGSSIRPKWRIPWRANVYKDERYNNKEEVIRKEAHPNKDWNVQWWGLW